MITEIENEDLTRIKWRVTVQGLEFSGSFDDAEAREFAAWPREKYLALLGEFGQILQDGIKQQLKSETP